MDGRFALYPQAPAHRQQQQQQQHHPQPRPAPGAAPALAVGPAHVAAAAVAPPPPSAAADPAANPAKNFLIIKELGRGSFGTVYLVERRSDGGRYALKQQELSGVPEEQKAAALNEARLLASARAPNVIKLREAFISSGGSKLNIVMELAKGGDLASLVKAARKRRADEAAAAPAAAAAAQGGGLPEPLVWSLLLQAAAGLSTCHALGVLHRDIKPQNLFLCDPCDPFGAGAGAGAGAGGRHPLLKVGDLGVAKAAALAATAIGTPLYMAPEVWCGRPYGPACDSWSLGCVAYELCALRVPFGQSARTQAEVRARVLSGRYAPLPVMGGAAAIGAGAAGGGGGGGGGGYSPELVRLIDELLCLDPLRRPTCADVLARPTTRKWAWAVPEAARGAVTAPPPPLPPMVAPGRMAPAAAGLLPAIPARLGAREIAARLPGKNYSGDGAAPPAAAAPAAAAGALPAAPAPFAPPFAAIKPPAAFVAPSSFSPSRPRVAGAAAPARGSASPYADALGAAPLPPYPRSRGIAAAPGAGAGAGAAANRRAAPGARQ